MAQGHDMDNIELTFPNLRYQEPPLLMHNNNGKSLVDVSAGHRVRSFMKRGPDAGCRRAIWNDGHVDVVVTTNGGPAYVLRNELQTNNHWLGIKLVGHKSNRDGIGAEIKVSTSKGNQFVTVSTAGSYLSSSDKRAHFGLGSDGAAMSVEIRWPSGVVQTLKNVRGDRMVVVDEPSSSQGAK